MPTIGNIALMLVAGGVLACIDIHVEITAATSCTASEHIFVVLISTVFKMILTPAAHTHPNPPNIYIKK